MATKKKNSAEGLLKMKETKKLPQSYYDAKQKGFKVPRDKNGKKNPPII